MVQVTQHAVDRYRERVRPGVSMEAARNALLDLAIRAERHLLRRPGERKLVRGDLRAVLVYEGENEIILTCWTKQRAKRGGH